MLVSFIGLFDLVTLSFLPAIGQFTLRFLSLSPVLLVRLQSTLNSIFFTSYQDHCSVFHLHDNLFVAFLFDRAISYPVLSSAPASALLLSDI
jgi:hypothetical protein